MKIDGACHCGNITFKAEVDESKVVVCHCADCQTLSGAAFRTVAFAPDSSFELLSGEMKVYVKTAESGNKREQTFCPECGSPVYSTSPGDGPKLLGLRVGTIRQRDRLKPSKQIWCGSAQDWIGELESVPKIEKQ
jgi:hypothetical protein